MGFVCAATESVLGRVAQVSGISDTQNPNFKNDLLPKVQPYLKHEARGIWVACA